MLFRVLLPSGRSRLYRGEWKGEGSPLGWRVLVPQGTTGVVVGLAEGRAEGEITFPDSAPLLGSAQLELVGEIAEDYMLPRGRVLFGLLPSAFLWKVERRLFATHRSGAALDALSREILTYVRRRGGVKPESLKKRFGTGPVNLLLRKGFLQERTEWVAPRSESRRFRLSQPLSTALKSVRSVSKRRLILFLSGRDSVSEEELLEWGFRRRDLNDLLRRGLLEIVEAEEHRCPEEGAAPSPVRRIGGGRLFLWGGLREILPALREFCLSKVSGGGSVLIIAAELDDVRRTADVLRTDLKDRVHEIHSKVPPGSVQRSWFTLQRNAGVLVGTFSALLCPLRNLSAVILLNESSPAVRLRSLGGADLRRICFLLARKTGAELVLTAPAPSVSAYLLVRDGRMKLLDLRGKPAVEVLERKPAEILTPALTERIGRSGGGRTLFLVPKQGYSYVFCPRCEDLAECPKCGTLLTYSQSRGKVYCSRCGYVSREPLCGECEGELEELGFGIEKVLSTVEEELGLREGFSFSTHPDWGESWDTVVVVSADSLLSLPTYRAREELFIYLSRAFVSAERELLIQTVLPEEETFRYLREGREKEFYLRELEEREREQLPPFWRLLLIKTARRELVRYVEKTVSPHLKVSFSPREECFHLLVKFRERRTLRKVRRLLGRFRRDIIEVRIDPF